jgi:8-oxo-dGTP diphosphatase
MTILQNFPTLRLVVAAALIRDDGHIFLQKRPEGKALAGLWEYPGGKVEPGETPEFALMRELKEEIGVAASPADMVPITFASQPAAGKHMILLLYVLNRWTGEAVAQEGQETGWFTLEQMADLPMPPADLPFIAPLAEYLARKEKV